MCTKLLFILVCMVFVSADYFDETAREYPLTHGWYKNRSTYYYNFGSRSPVNGNIVGTSQMLIFVYGIADNTPDLVVGQHIIFPVIPDDVAYSDLWTVQFVQVSSDYEPDSIRDYVTALSIYNISDFGPTYNCPFVPENSTLSGSKQDIIQGWYKNRSIYFFNFGQNTAFSAPMWVLTNNSGEQISQDNIVDAVPGDNEYSGFREIISVNVANDYNNIRSKDAILTGQYKMTPGGTINAPIVKTDPVVVGSSSKHHSEHSKHSVHSKHSEHSHTPIIGSGSSRVFTNIALICFIAILVLF